ncbi:MAG: type II secretion system protein GspC [Pseudomonadota bacterium]
MKSNAYQKGAINALLLIKGLVAACLLVWIAVSLAGLSLRLLPQPQIETAGIADIGRPEAGAETMPPVDIEALKNIKLFGDEVKPIPVQAVEETVQETVEETRLNLELVGSFASEDQSFAYAIIANGRKQGLYRVEEELDGLSNVKLMSVFSEKVILSNRGRQEALYMYPEGKPITSSAYVPPQSSGTPPANSSAARALSGLSPNQRLEKISDVIRFSRKTRDGRMVGFRVLPGRNRAAFEQTGLQLNDIVTAIDGQVLDNLKAANQIYQQKRNATQAGLTVLRGEQELAIDIDLNSININ